MRAPVASKATIEIIFKSLYKVLSSIKSPLKNNVLYSLILKIFLDFRKGFALKKKHRLGAF